MSVRVREPYYLVRAGSYLSLHEKGEKMKKVFFISLLFIFWFILVPWASLVFEMNKIIRRS